MTNRQVIEEKIDIKQKAVAAAEIIIAENDEKIAGLSRLRSGGKRSEQEFLNNNTKFKEYIKNMEQQIQELQTKLDNLFQAQQIQK